MTDGGPAALPPDAVLHRLGFLVEGLYLVQVTACVSPAQARDFCARLGVWRSSLPDPDRLRAVHAHPVKFVDERTALSPQKLIEHLADHWWEANVLDTSTWPSDPQAQADLTWWHRKHREVGSLLSSPSPGGPGAEVEVVRWSFVWNRGGEDDEATDRHVCIARGALAAARTWLSGLGVEMESRGQILGSQVQVVRPGGPVPPAFRVALGQLADSLRQEDEEHPWVPALREWSLALERQSQAPATPLPRRVRTRT